MTLGQGYAIGISGWEFAFLERAFGPLNDRQFGMGYGAVLVCGAFLFLFTRGIAAHFDQARSSIPTIGSATAPSPVSQKALQLLGQGQSGFSGHGRRQLNSCTWGDAGMRSYLTESAFGLMTVGENWIRARRGEF